MHSSACGPHRLPDAALSVLARCAGEQAERPPELQLTLPDKNGLLKVPALPVGAAGRTVLSLAGKAALRGDERSWPGRGEERRARAARAAAMPECRERIPCTGTRTPAAVRVRTRLAASVPPERRHEGQRRGSPSGSRAAARGAGKGRNLSRRSRAPARSPEGTPGRRPTAAPLRLVRWRRRVLASAALLGPRAFHQSGGLEGPARCWGAPPRARSAARMRAARCRRKDPHLPARPSRRSALAHKPGSAHPSPGQPPGGLRAGRHRLQGSPGAATRQQRDPVGIRCCPVAGPSSPGGHPELCAQARLSWSASNHSSFRIPTNLGCVGGQDRTPLTAAANRDTPGAKDLADVPWKHCLAASDRDCGPGSDSPHPTPSPSYMIWALCHGSATTCRTVGERNPHFAHFGGFRARGRFWHHGHQIGRAHV